MTPLIITFTDLLDNLHSAGLGVADEPVQGVLGGGEVPLAAPPPPAPLQPPQPPGDAPPHPRQGDLHDVHQVVGVRRRPVLLQLIHFLCDPEQSQVIFEFKLDILQDLSMHWTCTIHQIELMLLHQNDTMNIGDIMNIKYRYKNMKEKLNDLINIKP